MAPADPLNGPFPSSRDLTDYRDEPGYAIPPRDTWGRDAVSDALARIDRARLTASRKAT